MNSTTLPMPLKSMTVRELGDMAEARGMLASELLVELWPDADKTPANVAHA